MKLSLLVLSLFALLASAQALTKVVRPTSTSIAGWGKDIYTVRSIGFDSLTVSGSAYCGPISPPTPNAFGAVGFDIFINGFYAVTTALYHNEQNVHMALPPVQIGGISGANITIALASTNTLPDFSQVCAMPMFDVNDLLSLIFV